MEQLYQEHKGLVVFWAYRYARLCAMRAQCDVDDLLQAGFLGLVEAANTFDGEKGSWSGWASLYIRKEMRTAMGIGKKRVLAVSLDMPLNDGEEADTLESLVPDDSLPPVDARILADELRAAVRRAVCAIEDGEVRRAVKLVYLQRRSHRQAAKVMGVPLTQLRSLLRRGRQTLGRDRNLRGIAEEAGM